jgi:hypothetical protein
MMNTTAFRPLVWTVAVAVLASVALVFVAMSLGSRQAEAQEEGAVVIKDFNCSANLPPAPPLSTNEQSQFVFTPSGNAKFTCHFKDTPIEETTVQTGFLCKTSQGETTESQFVYTKSGKGTATCRIHPDG